MPDGDTTASLEAEVGDPLAKALQIVGGRWTLLLLFSLLDEPRSFTALRGAAPGISANVLSLRLRHLTASGMVTRAQSDGTYRLTARARELSHLHGEIRRWVTSVRAPSACSAARPGGECSSGRVRRANSPAERVPGRS